MLGNKSSKSGGEHTLVATNARVVGDIHFTGGLHVQGCVQGNLIAGPEGGDLIVGAGGLVEGEIHAPHVVINGEVRGNVHAGERLELAAKAVVIGDLHYRLIEVVVGARIDGALHHMAVGQAVHE